MNSSQDFSAVHQDSSEGIDAPVLIVVVKQPADLNRAIQERWYRIPMNRAPSRTAAEFLAFYQTGAFPLGERYLIRWMAPVRGYFLATRRQLIPEEPDHPRADEQYYKVSLGEPVPLPHPIPSRRLRRITFIPSTLSRLHQAEEINDLWIRSTAQQRLWEALKQAGLDGECQFPLQDDLPSHVADFALFCRASWIAVTISETSREAGELGESDEVVAEYLAQAGKWHLFRTSVAEIEQDATACASRLGALVAEMGGLESLPNEESLHA
jgi:hypothetical protein